MSAPLAGLGRRVLTAVRALGALALVVGRTALGLPRLERRELARGLMQFGYGSLALALAISAISGAIGEAARGRWDRRRRARWCGAARPSSCWTSC